MELWIRSQNKLSLVEAKTLTITEVEGKWCIVKLNALLDLEYRVGLGNYKTKERALEVLDEIQKILTFKCIINPKTIKFSEPYEGNGMVLMDCSADARLEQLSTYVYEMPEE